MDNRSDNLGGTDHVLLLLDCPAATKAMLCPSQDFVKCRRCTTQTKQTSFELLANDEKFQPSVGEHCSSCISLFAGGSSVMGKLKNPQKAGIKLHSFHIKCEQKIKWGPFRALTYHSILSRLLSGLEH